MIDTDCFDNYFCSTLESKDVRFVTYQKQTQKRYSNSFHLVRH